MKRLFILLLVLLSATTQAQIYQKDPSFGKTFNRGKFDSSLIIPIGDTLARTNIDSVGSIIFRTADALMYVKQTDKWQRIATGVTSVGLSLPSIFSITGSPVTTIGTLTGTLVSQSQNTIFAGPLGGSAAPTFRLLATADIPSLDAGKIVSGIFPIARGGTGLSVLGAANELLRVNAGATALEYFTPPYISAAITSLNALTASTQTFAVGTVGTDFNIASAISTHTFNIPSASTTARGVVTTGAQTIAGIKTFNAQLNAGGGLNVTGTATVSNIAALGSPATVLLTHTAGLLQSRTAAQVLSDIAATPTARTITVAGTAPIVSSAGAQDLTANRTWTLSHANSGVTPATYNWGTVNTTGHVTAANSVTLQGATTAGNTTGNGIQITGIAMTPATGAGLELQGTASTGYVFAYNRTGANALPLRIQHTGGNTFMNEGAGNVGIGTTTPTSKLVVADGTGGYQFDVTPSTVSDVVTFNARNGTTSALVPMRVNGNPIIFNDAGGNVGIGKDDPAVMLDVGGAGNFDGFLNIGGGIASITGLGSASFTSLAVSGITTLSGGLDANTITSPSIITTGEFRAPMRATGISTTLTATDYTLRATTSGITLTLPAASGCNGRIYILINYNTGGTVNTSAFLNFSAVSTTTIANQSSVMIQSDGTNWYLIK